MFVFRPPFQDSVIYLETECHLWGQSHCQISFSRWLHSDWMGVDHNRTRTGFPIDNLRCDLFLRGKSICLKICGFRAHLPHQIFLHLICTFHCNKQRVSCWSYGYSHVIPPTCDVIRVPDARIFHATENPNFWECVAWLFITGLTSIDMQFNLTTLLCCFI